ncbi:acetyl-CoA carboxylase, carboxyltransferase subunit beta [Sulfuriroseicoccus oceanibius]|uniref:Acetyl-coenzyme A carboxylase carboxyl transferase subunit beta n=1 Tax=Sulfuriroseicoccus oceanibius TaxID=2707525 RepID=A0A6B3LEY9_9BACT|nr:acetyl-CoA carboxylase, carboxyltransferase subunit beta [Sulfuriroseicoccus oceanibius]QQL45752.1 acetyl-CoA carboxylase carboxyltransferase subunit beta [Sulfuriroseicoccus oceanibius]
MGIFKRPRLKSKNRKSSQPEMPEGLWQKCPACNEVIHEMDLKQALRVCPKCDHHFMLGSRERIESIADEGSFEEFDANLVSVNPLGFANYESKIEKQREVSGLNDAVVTGRIKVRGNTAIIAVMDFKFFAGSMGSVVGEKITRAVEAATKEKVPVIVVCASSGARMQEGMLSLMQMAKTSGALARHHDAGQGYIAVLTHPTTGGVTASFATLGDVILAEPKCMIGFAGPRVVKETTHQNLPDGFQTAEFMLEHGLVDRIVERSAMRPTLARLIAFFSGKGNPLSADA